MKGKKTLKEKIVQSVFIYETKKFTFETVIKLVVLLISIGMIIVFGGVINDIYTENEMGGIGEYSYSKMLELGGVITNEMPPWLLILYGIGLILGCILIVSVIKNKKSISHKIRSLICYWFKL